MSNPLCPVPFPLLPLYILFIHPFIHSFSQPVSQSSVTRSLLRDFCHLPSVCFFYSLFLLCFSLLYLVSLVVFSSFLPSFVFHLSFPLSFLRFLLSSFLPFPSSFLPSFLPTSFCTFSFLRSFPLFLVLHFHLSLFICSRQVSHPPAAITQPLARTFFSFIPSQTNSSTILTLTPHSLTDTHTLASFSFIYSIHTSTLLSPSTITRTHTHSLTHSHYKHHSLPSTI